MDIKAIGNYMKVSSGGKTRYVINRSTQRMLEHQSNRYLYIDADEMKILRVLIKKQDGKFIRIA